MGPPGLKRSIHTWYEVLTATNEAPNIQVVPRTAYLVLRTQLWGRGAKLWPHKRAGTPSQAARAKLRPSTEVRGSNGSREATVDSIERNQDHRAISVSLAQER